MACTAGTPVGVKLVNAFATCLGATGVEAVEIVTDGTTIPPTNGTTFPTTNGTSFPPTNGTSFPLTDLPSTALPVQVVVNRKKKACKGRKCNKGKKRCPSVQDIKEKIEAEMKGTLIVQIK